MVNSLSEFQRKYGTTTTYQTVANPGWSTAAPSTPKKSGFFTNVAKSLVSVPAQAAMAVGHALADPFANLAQNNGAAISQGKTAGEIDAARTKLDQNSAGLAAAYKAGKISRVDYVKAIQDAKKQYLALSGRAAENATSVKSTTEMLPDAASAIFTAATLGAGAVEKGAAEAAGKAALAKIGLSKVGALAGRGLDATIGSGETLGNNIVSNVAGKIVRNAVVTQPTIQTVGNTATDLKKGNVLGAAGNAAMLAAPAAAAAVGKGVKAVAPVIKEAAFGRPAVLTDALGARVAQYIKDNPQNAAVLHQMEQFTLNQPAVGGDVKKAGEFLASHLKSIGVDPKTASMDQIVNQFGNYAKNVQKLEASGAPANAVVSADFREAIPKVVEKLKTMEGASAEERVKAANAALDELGIQNQTVRDQIGAALLGGAKPGELKAIVQKLVVPGVNLDKGFIATLGPKVRAELPALQEGAAPDLGRAANPVLGAVTSSLNKAGIGLENYNPAQIGDARKALISSIDNLGIDGVEGKSAYERLTKLTEDKRVTDLRQLRVPEIAQALDISNADARKVLNATKSMYDGVSISTRGLANKLTDANLKYNPLAAPYSRIQSSLRYGLNPAFRAQQRIEAATLGQIATGGHNPVGDVSKTVKMMRQDGLLPGADKSFAGEALNEGTKKVNITTNLTPSEENSLARVLQATAAKNGRSVEAELQDKQTRDLLRAIVQTPKTGFLSSNFAKALNIAVFPTSYNLKVATLAAKALAKQPKSVQFGVVKSIADFNNWLNTDQGIKWKSDNAELIGLISYFTPINSVQQIYDGVSSGNPAQLGLIGGLPFGVIQRVLEGQGVVPKASPPYLDPKTGQVVPDQIPTTDKARLQQGISDVLNTMFTYPGRQAGLGSKKDLLNTVTGNVLKPAKGETKSVDRSGEVTPQQQRVASVLSPSVTSQPSTFQPVLKTTAPVEKKPVKLAPTPVKGRVARPKVFAKKPS